MRGRLNLASQRFGNERLPVAGFSLLCAVLVAITIRHAFVIRGLLPGNSSGLHKEVAGLEDEAARLRKESAELRSGPKPEKARVEEWQLVKDLVDRRVFRWTSLFTCLGGTLPDDVRLVGIAPAVAKGTTTLSVDAAVKTMETGLAFIQTLEERPAFQDVYPKGVGPARAGEQQFSYAMVYLPDADCRAKPARPATASAAGAAGQ